MRYVFLHPKLRHFVAANTPGAIRVAVKSPKQPTIKSKVWRDSKGKFTTPQKAKRSKAAKKAAETRKIKRTGASFLAEYETDETKQRRRKYEMGQLNKSAIRAMVRRELEEGEGVTFYLIVRYLDSDGNEQFRQTGWMRANEKNAETAITATLQLMEKYEINEVISVHSVFGFTTSVIK
jgi:hypothetical protein